jgi:hypothetical protein
MQKSRQFLSPASQTQFVIGLTKSQSTVHREKEVFRNCNFFTMDRKEKCETLQQSIFESNGIPISTYWIPVHLFRDIVPSLSENISTTFGFFRQQSPWAPDSRANAFLISASYSRRNSNS